MGADKTELTMPITGINAIKVEKLIPVFAFNRHFQSGFE
jgi:hypothetical protein